MWRNNFVILIDGKLAQEFWTPGRCLTGGFFHSRGTKWGNRTLIKRKIDINKESSGMHCANKIWTGPPNILFECYGGSQGSTLSGQEGGREGGRGKKDPSSIKRCVLGVCSGEKKVCGQCGRERSAELSARQWQVRFEVRRCTLEHHISEHVHFLISEHWHAAIKRGVTSNPKHPRRLIWKLTSVFCLPRFAVKHKSAPSIQYTGCMLCLSPCKELRLQKKTTCHCLCIQYHKRTLWVTGLGQ